MYIRTHRHKHTDIISFRFIRCDLLESVSQIFGFAHKAVILLNNTKFSASQASQFQFFGYFFEEWVVQVLYYTDFYCMSDNIFKNYGVSLLLAYYYHFIFSHAIVTRMLTRVLKRANVQELSRISVIVNRNRRYDAVALPLRNVIVQRRMSGVPAQQPPRIRRLSLAITRQPPGMNVDIQQGNVDQLIRNQSGANAETDEEINQPDSELTNRSDIEMGDESNAETAQLEENVEADVNAEMSQPDSVLPNRSDIEMSEESNVAVSMNAVTSTADLKTDGMDMTIEQSNDDGQKSQTAFPGHTKKAGRKSFFETKDMDKYVRQFQPAQAPRRRHSMMSDRPPLSRMNRFSLDAIPEERDEAQQRKNETRNVSLDGPLYPSIRWQIPDLIPIVGAKKMTDGQSKEN